MKILVADRFDSSTIEALKASGEVEVRAEATADELPGLVSELRPSALLVRSTRVTAKTLHASDRLSLVVRAGAGCDTIDVAEASRRGIHVACTPGKNAIAVAELVWGLILACDRRIPDQIQELRAGRWNRSEYAKANGLWGKTLGIVGFGQIGREVASRAKAFGMRVVAWSRRLTEDDADKAGVDYVANIVNVARLADVVSVSVVSNPETQDLLGEKFFNAMRTGAIFVNTSRVGVVDEKALAKAVVDKQLRCGIDIFTQEPQGGSGEIRNDLLKLPSIFGTHHIGAQTDQAQRATATEAVRVIRVWSESGQVLNCVNRAAATPATAVLTVRHLNKPGVLAHIFYTLGQAQINVEEMDNVVYEGGEAACAKIQLSRLPSEEHIVTIRKNPNVLGTSLSLIKR
ncbi:MAG: hydroxyacid dehydrogenase [Phycisphaerae bacterium]|jgi:D-3-phosphoglycerate dehydrogenase|nr:hydroxyacid dehydrogenase [Phycisphaerae bacterium]